jgi:dynein heavy chain 1
LGARLLTEVRRDLNQLLATCRNEQKQNNHTRELIAALVKSKRVPPTWLSNYSVPKDVTAHEWMCDFVERVKQLDRLSKSAGNLRAESIWLGGMFFPEAYITATRQLIAQTNGWSLEQLTMHVTAVGDKGSAAGTAAASATTFTLTGTCTRN